MKNTIDTRKPRSLQLALALLWVLLSARAVRSQPVAACVDIKNFVSRCLADSCATPAAIATEQLDFIRTGNIPNYHKDNFTTTLKEHLGKYAFYDEKPFPLSCKIKDNVIKIRNKEKLQWVELNKQSSQVKAMAAWIDELKKKFSLEGEVLKGDILIIITHADLCAAITKNNVYDSFSYSVESEFTNAFDYKGSVKAWTTIPSGPQPSKDDVMYMKVFVVMHSCTPSSGGAASQPQKP